MNQKIITISRGPQFKGPLTFVGITFGIILFFFSLINLLNGHIIIFLISAPIFVGFVNLTAGFEGIEIDLEKQLFRNYRIIFWIKVRLKWEDFSRYCRVHLVKEKSIIGENAPVVSRGMVARRRSHISYNVKLMKDDGENFISLREFGKYEKAKAYAYDYAQKLNLNYRDFVKEQAQIAMNNRKLRSRL